MALISPDLSGIVDGATPGASAWTTPMNTIINAINGNLDTNNFTAAGTNISTIAASVGWTTWAPTYGAGGSMTFTSVSSTYTKYEKIGRTVRFMLEATGTTGGSASNIITFTLPFTMATAAGMFAAQVGDTSNLGAFAVLISTTVVAIEKYDLSNFGLGASRTIRCQGTYEAVS